MAQYYTDFSEYSTGVQPSDWTERLANGDWTVENDADGNYIVANTTDNLTVLTWDNKSTTDCEITLLKTAADYESTALRPIGRMQSGEQTFYDMADNSAADEFDMGRYVTGTYTILGTESVAQTEGVKYWSRLRANGDTIKGKMWEEGTSEPSSWQFTVTDSGITSSGFVGLQCDNLSIKGYEFGVGTNGDTAPTTPVSTPPSAPTNLTATLQ